MDFIVELAHQVRCCGCFCKRLMSLFPSVREYWQTPCVQSALQARSCIRSGLWLHSRRSQLWKLHCCSNISSSSQARARGQTPIAMGGSDDWRSLNTPSSELRLEFTLPTGQSFRWRQTGPQDYMGVIQQRVVCTPPPLHLPPLGPRHHAAADTRASSREGV